VDWCPKEGTQLQRGDHVRSKKKAKEKELLKKQRNDSSKKERTITTKFKIAEIAGPVDSLSINVVTGQFQFLSKGQPVAMRAEDVSTDITYPRGKGPKILNSVPGLSHDLRVFSSYSFIDQFDVMFAVDTNTRTIDGVRCSIAAMCILRTLSVSRDDENGLKQVNLNLNMFGAVIRGFDLPDNPENWMWRVAIEEGIKQRYPDYSDSLRIGLVVDSNYGLLSEYNCRTTPIHEDYFLPNNFTLMYASADAGSEFILNRMIRLCDRESGLQLDALERGEMDVKVFTKCQGHETLAALTVGL